MTTASDPVDEVDGTADVKRAARRVLEEIFPADDEAALRDALSPDCINHEAPPGTPSGPDSVVYFMHMLARAFSDQRWSIESIVAEGDLVAMRCVHSGRHTGEFFGMPASGNSFAYSQIHMVKVVAGKGAEHWGLRDDASLRRQLVGG